MTRLVEILAAQERVAVGRFHLEHAVADLQDGDVERAAAQIVDGDRARALALKPVGQSCRGRLVDDAQHLKPGDLAGVLGRLALAVVEIGRDGDDGLGHGLAEIGLGRFLHLLQDEGADLGGRVFLAATFNPGVAIVARQRLERDEFRFLAHQRVGEAPADEPLDAVESILRIGHGLALGRLADQTFPGFREGDLRGGRPHALAVLDHLGGLALHHGDARIRRPEIDPDYLCHVHLFLQQGRAAR